MMEIIPKGVFVYGSAFCILFVLINMYFYIAKRFNIVDVPNNRSSHGNITIRGGGIIFWFSLVLFFMYSHFEYVYFFLGISMVGFISFIDDIKPLPFYIRMTAQFISISLIFYELGIFIDLPIWAVGTLAIVMVGTVNAYNFMDGINGITGLYSLVTLLSLWYVNKFIVNFVDGRLLGIVGVSVVVFLFYNLRKSAKCFAGDVGSVTMAYLLLFFLFKLSFTDGFNPLYFLFLAVYGVDSVVTIIIRLLKRENIFEAHRSHVYQLYANEGEYSHRDISLTYSVLQLSINIMIVSVMVETPLVQCMFAVGLLTVLILLYLVARSRFRVSFLD